MDAEKIENLEDLLRDFLKPHQTLVGHDVRRLTAPGENYGSLMLAVDIHLRENGENKTIHAVAKKPVPNEFLQKIFQPKITFRNEIAFYREIVPWLQQFQKNQGLDKVIECFPDHIASRFNLKHGDSDDIDPNVILMLENLHTSGFETEDRTKGFDYHTTLLILDDLAEFHSIPIAMRNLKPDEFDKKIKNNPIFQPYKQLADDLDGQENGLCVVALDILSKDEFCKEFLHKIQHVFKENVANTNGGKNCQIGGPFDTMIHTDFWVNNTMIKVEDGRTVQNKMVDFQFYELGSPARDVIFFIFTSVQLPVVEEKFDHLLDYYYRSLINNLKKLKCDYLLKFTRQKFQEELKSAIQYSEFSHALSMLAAIIQAPKDGVKELSEFNELTLDEATAQGVPEGPRLRSRFIVRKCIEKGWI